jgi:hypothetical protein
LADDIMIPRGSAFVKIPEFTPLTPPSISIELLPMLLLLLFADEKLLH